MPNYRTGDGWSYNLNLKSMPKEESNDEQKNSPLSSPFYQQPTHKDSSPSSLSDKNSVDVFRLLKSNWQPIICHRRGWIQKGMQRHYLHTSTGVQSRVIHRNVRNSNVLLDANFVAKISDFWLPITTPTYQLCTTDVYKDQIKGTFGYMDAEYFSTYRVARKRRFIDYGDGSTLIKDEPHMGPFLQFIIKQIGITKRKTKLPYESMDMTGQL
ncbi:serine/threonine/dual specificity protein kinase, catalytic domain-containing protein [Tanacetum coccineum]